MKILYLSLILFLIGCVARVYNIQKPRSDLDIKGNRGYIVGTPPPEKPLPKKKTRTITVLEIEFGPSKVVELEETPSKSLEPKSQEYISQKIEEPVSEKETETVVVEEEPLTELTESEEIKEPQIPQEEFITYKVQKGDTLQKISYKFYGTHKKWKKIFEANKDKIKDPDFIKEGLILKIPK